MFFLSLLFKDPQAYFLWIFLVVFSVCVHEYFHALAAMSQGDMTAADNGHLTLNPLVQMGVVPIIILLLVGITWGATPVNPSNFRKKYSAALVSFAGPFANLTLYFLFCLLIVLASRIGFDNEGFMALCGLGAVLNFVLFAFNMIPVPPLDGFSVVCYFFPSIAYKDSEFKNAAMFIIFMIAFMFFGKLYWLAEIAARSTIQKISLLFSYIA